MAPNKSTGREFVIERVFDAPRELVWKAFTELECLKHWWGPKGFKMVSCKMDLRPSGVFHYGMEAPNGSVMWGHGCFTRSSRRSGSPSSFRSPTRTAA